MPAVFRAKLFISREVTLQPGSKRLVTIIFREDLRCTTQVRMYAHGAKYLKKWLPLGSHLCNISSGYLYLNVTGKVAPPAPEMVMAAVSGLLEPLYV